MQTETHISIAETIVKGHSQSSDVTQFQLWSSTYDFSGIMKTALSGEANTACWQ